MASSTSPAPATTWFDKYLAFVKAHETIIIELVAGLMLWGTASSVLKRWDTYESRKVTAAQTVVKSDTSSNDAIAAQIAKMRAEMDTKLSALKAKTDAETKAISVAPAPVVAPILGGSVSSNGSDINLPLPAARKDATALIQAPVISQENTDLSQIQAQDQTLITGLQKQLGDQTKACTAQVAELKVKSKRSFLRGFKYGLIVGLGAGAWLEHKL